MNYFKYKLENESHGMAARTGMLSTPHGVIKTPVFMPVATQATVKTVTPDELKQSSVQIILANTYHLYLRPGADLIAQHGGLHNFMRWNGPILTDSGGFQVLSLGHLRQINDEGVIFRSYIDGNEHQFTPELAIEVQNKLGPDIIMAFDECSSYGDDYESIKRAMERTHIWAERCLQRHKRNDQALFGIIQGGTFKNLRQDSAKAITSMDFPGFALGGLSVGESKEITWNMVEETVPFMPETKPRYLMGVGSPEDLIEGVARGIDMFDSVLPTRVARNGALYTMYGRININKADWKDKDIPIENSCDCYTCNNFSIAYLHHLFKSREILGYRLATIHNLRFLMILMEKIRESIASGTFTSFKTSFLSNYKITNEETRHDQKKKWIDARQHKKSEIHSPVQDFEDFSR